MSEHKYTTNKGWSNRPFKGEWAKTLQKFLQKQQDTVPAGWFRGEDALGKMGFKGTSSGHRNKLLNTMTAEGFLEKKNFRIFDGSNRRVVAISHYRLKKQS